MAETLYDNYITKIKNDSKNLEFDVFTECKFL